MSRTKDQHKAGWGSQSQHGIARKAELGNTNTPLQVAKIIVERTLGGRLAGDQYKREHWLEPAVGAGSFYLALVEMAQEKGLNPFQVAQRIDAVDIDEEAIEVFKARLQEKFGWSTEKIGQLNIWHLKDGLAELAPKYKYDLIVTNPPYLSPTKWASSEGEREDKRAKWLKAVEGVDKRADLYMYFFHWALEHLTQGGKMVFLCSDTWLDANYGSSLRQALRTSYHLEKIISWPWKAIFRDDTCPIVTVIGKKGIGDGETVIQIDDGDVFSDQTGTVYQSTAVRRIVEQRMTAKAVNTWLAEGTKNRRQRVITGGDLLGPLQDSLAMVQEKSGRLGDFAEVNTFGWSFNDLEKSDLVVEPTLGKTGVGQSEEDTVAIFFQQQARVGKPANYAQAKQVKDLIYRAKLTTGALADKIKKAGGLVKGGVWVGTAIDRFPLAFYLTGERGEEEPEVLGVSKYLYLKAIKAWEDEATRVGLKSLEPAVAAILTSTPLLLAMEGYLKEGTRKTLRKGENGFVKAITKGDLRELPWPRLAEWQETSLRRIAEIQQSKGARSLSRLEEVIKDSEWLEIDQIVLREMQITPQQGERMRALLEVLYWRRMRNVVEYGPALKAFQQKNS